MTNLEKINQLFDKIKTCPVADIHHYFSPVMDTFLTMTAGDSKACAGPFYEWAKENEEKEPIKYLYGCYLFAVYYLVHEDYAQSLPLLINNKKSAEERGEMDCVALCGIIIGVIYRTFGNFDLAVKSFWEAYNILKPTGRYQGLFAAVCNDIGSIDFELHNYDEAILMYNTTIEVSIKIGAYYFNIYALLGLGKINMLEKNFTSATDYFEKALQLANESKNPTHISASLSELATFYFGTNNPDEAEKYNKQSLAIREQNNFMGGAITNCINLGEIYITQSKWDDALQILNKGLALAEQLKVKPKIYQAHFLLSKLYKSQNDPVKSLYHFEIFHELKEKVQEEDNARKLADAKLVFEAEQTKKENIIIKKQKLEIQNKNIELQDTIDELTLARVSRKAKALTIVVAVVLFIFEDPILVFALNLLQSHSYFLSLTIKMAIIFSLSPINKLIETYLLKKVIKRKKREDKLVFESGAPA